ncbi:MAG: universal stress protein [Desulfosalsimonadaceae bacterium]
MKNLLKSLQRKSSKLRSKVDRYQESITFAEGGEATPSGAAEKKAQHRKDPAILLVIGNGDTFSKEMIDYAIEMAQRLSYNILALNLAPLPRETSRLFAPSREKLREFEATAEQNAQEFKEKAAEKGISFSHAVKFGEQDSAIKETEKEYGGVEFVISEPGNESAEERPEKENRPEKRMFVYSLH